MKLRDLTWHEMYVRSLQIARRRAETWPVYRSWLHSGPVLAPGVGRESLFHELDSMLAVAFVQNQPASAAIVARADRALEGIFDVFEMKHLKLGALPDWHFDPRHGKRSPLVPWKQLDNLDESRTGNKKYVWEINRHHHVVELARAYVITTDERYARGVVMNIVDWIDANPPAIGINWVSSLELAFRCINWLWAIALVRASAAWAAAPMEIVARSIDAQMRHVERFLSTYSSPNTHLTGEALALYYTGACLPGLVRAQRWRELGRSILLEQAEIQVRADGGYFEQSTWYHRYTVEFYLQFAILAARRGEPLPEETMWRIQKAIDFLMLTMRPNGTWPRFGDDDGGTLLPLGAGSGDDWRSLLAIAGALLKRPDYRFVASGHEDDALWLLDRGCIEAGRALEGRKPVETAAAFVQSGWYVMRSDWSADANFLMIDAGPHGAMNCGHAHADALSMELSGSGVPLLVDRGTFTYSATDPARDEFRSTAMHNTLELGGVGASLPGGAFQWQTTARAGSSAWFSSRQIVHFRGWQDGYQRLPDPATHYRSVLFINREYWVLLDQVESANDVPAAVHFHWHPAAVVAAGSDCHRVVGAAAGVKLELIYPTAEGDWQFAACAHSPGFGEQEAAVRTSYRAATGRQGMLCVMYPGKASQASPDVQSVPVASGRAMVVRSADHSDVILWRAPAAPAAVEIEQSDFEWLWVRSRLDNPGMDTIIALDGHQLMGGTFAIESGLSMDFLKVVRDRGGLAITTQGKGSFRLRVGATVKCVTVNGRDVNLAAERDAEWAHGRSDS